MSDATMAATLRPDYYRGHGGLQPLDVIRAWSLGFELGNAVKYVLRAGRKGAAAEDLRKAYTYVALVRDRIAAGEHLDEWGAKRVSHLAPVLVVAAFDLDEWRGTAVGAIHDLSRGHVMAGHFVEVALLAISAAQVRLATVAADDAAERQRAAEGFERAAV